VLERGHPFQLVVREFLFGGMGDYPGCGAAADPGEFDRDMVDGSPAEIAALLRQLVSR
jgi:hypothetical protein